MIKFDKFYYILLCLLTILFYILILPEFVDENLQKNENIFSFDTIKLPFFYIPYLFVSDFIYLRFLTLICHFFNINIIFNYLENKNYIFLYPLLLFLNFDNRGFYYLAENLLSTILLYILLKKDINLLILSLLIKPFAIFFILLFNKIKYIAILIYSIIIIIYYQNKILHWVFGYGLYFTNHFPYFLFQNITFLIIFIIVLINLYKEKYFNELITFLLIFILIFFQPSHHHYLLILYPVTFLLFFENNLQNISCDNYYNHHG